MVGHLSGVNVNLHEQCNFSIAQIEIYERLTSWTFFGAFYDALKYRKQNVSTIMNGVLRSYGESRRRCLFSARNSGVHTSASSHTPSTSWLRGDISALSTACREEDYSVMNQIEWALELTVAVVHIMVSTARISCEDDRQLIIYQKARLYVSQAFGIHMFYIISTNVHSLAWTTKEYFVWLQYSTTWLLRQWSLFPSTACPSSPMAFAHAHVVLIPFSPVLAASKRHTKTLWDVKYDKLKGKWDM